MPREVVTMPIWGWDSSHYDAPDQRAALAEGYSFFTHKVGGDALDAEYASWWSYMKTVSPTAAMLGGYWVLYPDNPVTRANSFVSRLDAVSPGWRDRPYILQADCEIWAGNTGTLPSVAEINAFGDRLADLAPKLRMIAYAPKWCYGSGLGALRYPIWSSRYVTGSGAASNLYPGDSSSLWGAYSGGGTPAVLQFSSSATIAGQTTCDANAFRGTLADLQALLAPGWEPLMTSVDLTQGAIDAVAKATAAASAAKIHVDLVNSASGLFADMRASEARIVASLKTQVDAMHTALAAAITALAAKDVVDEAALAQQLGQVTASAVVAQLPADPDRPSVDDMAAAFEQVLTAHFAQPAAGGRHEANIDDVDARTAAERTAAQSRIMGE